jgi:hypothetical protein
MGVDVDYNLVNVHLCRKLENGYLLDMGIFPNMDEAGTPANRALYAAGELEVMLTQEDVRDAIPHGLYRMG